MQLFPNDDVMGNTLSLLLLTNKINPNPKMTCLLLFNEIAAVFAKFWKIEILTHIVGMNCGCQSFKVVYASGLHIISQNVAIYYYYYYAFRI